MPNKFSEAVSKEVRNYVYRLIDPRNGETFYVGKGKGNRVFQHADGVRVAKGDEKEGAIEPKYDRIREIKNAHLQVIHVIHRHDIPDVAIFEVEAAVIDAYPGLTNVQGGFGSGSKGPMNTTEIIDKYELPELDLNPPEKLLLININALEDKSRWKLIYDQVRCAWRVDRRRAEQAEYILAVQRGVVIGAFVADRWLEATMENFPNRDLAIEDRRKRYGFVGKKAPDDIWERFVGERGKRITNESMKHIRAPLRYWNI